jgi:hypothetical protein
MTEQQLLVLLAPRERRDDLVDLLMGQARLSGFTLVPALGYSREHSHFSVEEQVAGYRENDRFEVFAAAADMPGILRVLQAAAGRERLRYYLLPIAGAGLLTAAAEGTVAGG